MNKHNDITEQLTKLCNNHKDTTVRIIAMRAMYRIDRLERALNDIQYNHDVASKAAEALKNEYG